MAFKEIFFKAWEGEAWSHWEYRKIIKRWEWDNYECADDVIQIITYEKNIFDLKIDCNKETGEFRIFWQER